MMLKSLLISCLVILAVAREKRPCEISNNVEEEDWNKLKADSSNPSDKMLCLFKCIYAENGNMNSEGVLNVEKMIENVNKMQPLDDAAKTSIRECVKDLGPIKTCADTSPSYHCVRKVFPKNPKKVV